MFVVKHAILGILALLCVVGNSLLIITILIHRQLRTPANLLVVALASADLSVGLLAIPMHVAGERQLLDDSPEMCLVSMAWTSAQIVVSVLMLFVFSLERYMNLVHPFEHRKWLSRRRIVTIILLAWGYGVLFGCLPLFGWNSLHRSHGNSSLDNGNDTYIRACHFEYVLTGPYIACLFLGHVVPAAVILPLLHIHVFLTARRVLHHPAKHSTASVTKHQHPSSYASLQHERKQTKYVTSASVTKHVPTSSDKHVSHKQMETAPSTSTSLKIKRNLRPFKILAMMVVYFIVSWAPLAVWETVVFEGFTKPYLTPEEIFASNIRVIGYNVTVSLAVLNSVLNPLFYGVGNRMIWRSFVTMMTCKKWEDERGNGHLSSYKMYKKVARNSRDSQEGNNVDTKMNA